MPLKAGSADVRRVLEGYAEIGDAKEARKSARKLDADLAVQQLQNAGQAEVANLRNTGALDVQKSSEGSLARLQEGKLTAEQPLVNAQARSLNAHSDLYEAQAGVVGQQRGALAKQEDAKASLLAAQAEGQSFTNELAKKYGEPRLQNELGAQAAGTEKVGMELDLLKQEYDKSQNDSAMKRANDYQQHPNSIARNIMQDWITEKHAAAQLNPLAMSRSQLNEYSDSILGEPSLGYKLGEKIPLVGMIPRLMRGYEARNKAKKISGVALPE